MYKVASDGRQRALHQGRPADWVNGEEVLAKEDQLRQMQRGVEILDARIQALPKNSERRKALGLQKLAMQNELSAFRKNLHLERRAKEGLSVAFMDVAKEMLPPLQFRIINAAAHREYEARQAAFLKQQQASE